VAKWVNRFHAEEMDGLRDRSSRPFHRLAKLRLPPALPSRLCVASATRASRSPPRLGISQATVSRILRRLGLDKLSTLEPAEPPRRYERERPSEMIHIDIKSWAGSTA
jgi:hypothetical protein